MLNVTVADVSFTLDCLRKNILKITGKKGLDNTPKNVRFYQLTWPLNAL
jgi:hypothetical protein